jgi:hypothetical protein
MAEVLGSLKLCVFFFILENMMRSARILSDSMVWEAKSCWMNTKSSKFDEYLISLPNLGQTKTQWGLVSPIRL